MTALEASLAKTVGLNHFLGFLVPELAPSVARVTEAVLEAADPEVGAG